MKTVLMTLIGILPVNLLYSQQMTFDPTSRRAVEIVPPTPQERYKVDYQLSDESLLLADSLILNTLDLVTIDGLRMVSQDVIHTDSVTGVEIIIYSEEKVAKRGKARTESNYFKD